MFSVFFCLPLPRVQFAVSLMLCEDVLKFFLITLYGVNMKHVLTERFGVK